jgi:sugar phosphate permease
MLSVSTSAQAAASITINGPAFLIPVLHERRGLSLAEAATVAAAPFIGVMVTLVLWGLAVDHYGERFVLLAGLLSTGAAGFLAMLADDTVPLFCAFLLAGAAAASTASASGRVVAGWFPPHRRGTAMGIRQMAQPVGLGIAAVTVAPLADRHGIAAALWVPALTALAGAAAVALVVTDPPRPDRATTVVPNPYRQDGYLARIHTVSVLLVVPQGLVWLFSYAYLVTTRDWSPGAAGTLIAIAQLLGALGRIAAGALSDRVASRMRPLVWVSAGAAATMALLGLADWQDWAIAVALIVAANVVTVADNGLAFTAVAERAGPFWSGRALGVQNTAQYLTAAALAPVAGFAIGHWGYAATFALCALFPLLALPVVPVHGEHELR